MYVVLYILTHLSIPLLIQVLASEYNNSYGFKRITDINRASHLLQDPEYPSFNHWPGTHNLLDNLENPASIFLKSPSERKYDDENIINSTESAQGIQKSSVNTTDSNDASLNKDKAANSDNTPKLNNDHSNEINDMHHLSVKPDPGIVINNSIEDKKKPDDSFYDIKQAIYSLYQRAISKGVDVDQVPKLNTNEDIFKALDKLDKLIDSYTYNLKSADSGIVQQFTNEPMQGDVSLDTPGRFLQLSKSNLSFKTPSQTKSAPSVEAIKSFLDEFICVLNEIINKNTGIVDLLGQVHPNAPVN